MGRGRGSLLVSMALAAGFSFLITADMAYAYIDAGTGSLALQMLLGAGFGLLFMLKVFWGRVTGQLSRFRPKKKNVPGPIK